MKIFGKIAFTSIYVGPMLSLVGTLVFIALQDSAEGSNVAFALIYSGGLFCLYSVFLNYFYLCLEFLRGEPRFGLNEKLSLSIFIFGLGLLVASPLSLLLLIFLQLDIVAMIGIGILAIGGFSLFIGFLLVMIQVLVDVWRE